MKKSTRFILVACAAVMTAFSAVACQSTKDEKPDPAKAFVKMEKSDVKAIFNAPAPEGEAFAKIQPDTIYVAENLADKFTLAHPKTSDFDEEGYLCARVYGQLAELSFFEWLVYADYVDDLAYRFIWFDNNGKIIKKDSRTMLRITMPGDPVRFSAKAPGINDRKFSIVIGYADSFDAKDAKADKKADKKDAKADKKADAKADKKADKKVEPAKK